MPTTRRRKADKEAYWQSYAVLDAFRRVLHCRRCGDCAQWCGIVNAIAAGWQYEDKRIDGSVFRFWSHTKCPKRKHVE